MQNENTAGLDALTQAVAVAVEACREAGAAGQNPAQALGSALVAVAMEHRTEWDDLEELAIKALTADQRKGERIEYNGAKTVAEEAEKHFQKAMERGQVAAWVAGLPRILAELKAEYKGHSFPWLGELEIPDPGLTIFGARSGGGKTTALYNAARCLLQEGKKVLFITREPTPGETALNVARSLQGDLVGVKPEEMGGYMAGERVCGWIENGRGFGGTYPETLRLLHGALVHNKHLPPFFLSAWQKVEEWIRSEALVIMDGPADEKDLAQAVAAYPEHVVLLDYLQAFRSTGRQDGYQRMQDVMAVVRELAKSRCILAGAQFNREGFKGGGDKTGKPERGFVPIAEQLREAADLEQAAHLVLGLGWKETQQGKAYYWHCLKHRYNGAMRDLCFPSHIADPVPFLYTLGSDAWGVPEGKGKQERGKEGQSHSEGGKRGRQF